MKNAKQICTVKEVIGDFNISSDKMKDQLGITDEEMHNLEYGYKISQELKDKFFKTYNVKL